jgi:glucose uptake protein
MAWHVLGLLAGLLWSFGTVFNFVSAGKVGMAISWGVGSGAPMIGALWGIFLWKEFAGAGRNAKVLIGTSLALYASGVAAVALSYTGQ